MSPSFNGLASAVAAEFTCSYKCFFQSFLKQFSQDYLTNYIIGVEATKVKIYYSECDDDDLEVFLKTVKDGKAFIKRGWPKVLRAFDMEAQNGHSISSLLICCFYNSSIYCTVI